MRYAGFWPRLGAGLVDVVVLLPLTGVLWYAGRTSRLGAAVAAVAGAAAGFAYTVGLTARGGQTVGKRVLGIQVRRASDGGPVGWPEAWRRSAVDAALSAAVVAGTLLALSRVPEYGALAWTAQPARLRAALPWLGWADRAYTWWVWGELVTALLHPRRRALHDLLGGTVVVHTPTAAPGPAGPARNA